MGGGKLKWKGIHEYIQLIHIVVRQKPTIIILQLKINLKINTMDSQTRKQNFKLQDSLVNIQMQYILSTFLYFINNLDY